MNTNDLIARIEALEAEVAAMKEDRREPSRVETAQRITINEHGMFFDEEALAETVMREMAPALEAAHRRSEGGA